MTQLGVTIGKQHGGRGTATEVSGFLPRFGDKKILGGETFPPDHDREENRGS
jgi:hypothetical protein